MSGQESNTTGRELRISITEEVYEQLKLLAADHQVPAEEYAARMIADDVARARFLTGAREFITENADYFTERFGPHSAGGQVA